MSVREAMVLRAILFTLTLSLLPACAHAQTSSTGAGARTGVSTGGGSAGTAASTGAGTAASTGAGTSASVGAGTAASMGAGAAASAGAGTPRAWARAPPPAPASGAGQLPGLPPEPGAQQDKRLQQGPPQAGLTAKPLERHPIAISAIALRSKRQSWPRTRARPRSGVHSAAMESGVQRLRAPGFCKIGAESTISCQKAKTALGWSQCPVRSLRCRLP